MKIFWSWQSDTHGKNGRHFVRECLVDAIAAVNEPLDVDEPSEQERKDPVELDQDRVGVVGHPSLADAIFKKIAGAAVFVADVTLVAALKVEPTDDNPDGVKRLINSNVAIEYGYAVGKLTDDATLLVMNLHYGPLTKLPFDLGHKVAPCRYRLAPDAPAAEFAKAKRVLTSQLRQALRLHIGRVTPPLPVVPFQPTPATSNRAVFWEPGEVLARYDASNPLRYSKNDDSAEYRFDEPRILYLRLIPTVPLPEPFTFRRLMDIVELRRVRLMTRILNAGKFHANKYGALSYTTSGTNPTPVAMTQLHTNGEIWAVTREFWVHHANEEIIDMVGVKNRVGECLANSIEVARDEMKIEPPYKIEIGAVGLKQMRLSRPEDPMHGYVNRFTDRVLDSECFIQKVLQDVTPAVQERVVRQFLRKVYALAAVDFEPDENRNR